MALTRSSGSSAPFFRTMGSDVQWTQSFYWVDKHLATYTHLHNAYLSILMRKNYHRPIGAFWSTTNTTSPTFRLSVASLHFLWVLSVARNSSLQCLQNSFTRLRISIQRLLRSKKVSMGWWLLRLSSKILALLGLSVNFFQLLLTKKLKINFFCFKE